MNITKMLAFTLLCTVSSVVFSNTRFDQLLDKVAFEASDIQSRLEGYKRLIEYAQRSELDAPHVARFMAALEATYRARDLNNRAVLLGLQEVFCRALQSSIFAPHHEQARKFLTMLSCDLKPFAVKFGDCVAIEVCGRAMFCTTQQHDNCLHVVGCPPPAGKQLRVDSLFTIAGGQPGQVVTFGQQLQLQPLYAQRGGYMLPLEAGLNFACGSSVRRGVEGGSVVLSKKSDIEFALTSPIGVILQGAPVVIHQEVQLVDTSRGVALAMPAGATRFVLQNKELADGNVLSLRIVKSQTLDRVHKKLVKANVDLALKQATPEGRIEGLLQVLNAVRGGIGDEELVRQQEVLQSLYAERSVVPPHALRLLEKLFVTAAHHSCFAQSKLVFEQYAGQVHDDLCAKAVSFGDVVTMAAAQQRALQLVLDESLTSQGHLVVAADGRKDTRLMGQQCITLASPAAKRGALSYSDEVTLTSYFVNDGRDGGLLACPVMWWVDSSPQESVAQRVLASGATAVQTRGGQEIFTIINATVPAMQGPVLAGDAVHLVSKHTKRMIEFGEKQKTGTFVVQKASKKQLVELADKRFRQYVQRISGEDDVHQRTAMLGAALDLFKGQKLLSSQAGKLLYAQLKNAAVGSDIASQETIKQLLAKAQEAPFSAAAKKRFMTWHAAIGGEKKS